MADVILTFKIMPKSPEIDLEKVSVEAKNVITDFGAELGKTEIEPIAFGLKALNLFVVMNENLGSTDNLEEKMRDLEGVNSVEVTDVRRAIG